MNRRPDPLFVDTAALFARFNRRAAEHDRARAAFEGIRTGDLRYDPLFTSRYVLSELATLMRRKVGHAPAVEAVTTIRDAESINVLRVGDAAFDIAPEQFARFDDQQISFVDHTAGFSPGSAISTTSSRSTGTTFVRWASPSSPAILARPDALDPPISFEFRNSPSSLASFRRAYYDQRTPSDNDV